MIIRVPRSRVALLTVVLLGATTIARASSISSSDAAAVSSSATPQAELSTIELSGISDSPSALDLVADVSLTSTQPQLSLAVSESTGTTALAETTPPAPTFLTAAAPPLNLSDVPEPTTFGLFLLGLAGLFAARRITRKA